MFLGVCRVMKRLIAMLNARYLLHLRKKAERLLYKENKAKRAVAIYEKMIALGDVDAYETLGGVFLEGKVVERDIARGYHYYELGAKNHNQASLFYLGILNAFGDLVPANPKRAYRYFYKLCNSPECSLEYAARNGIKYLRQRYCKNAK